MRICLIEGIATVVVLMICVEGKCYCCIRYLLSECLDRVEIRNDCDVF